MGISSLVTKPPEPLLEKASDLLTQYHKAVMKYLDFLQAQSRRSKEGCLESLKKYIDKSLKQMSEQRERDDTVIDRARMEVEAMEEGEERKRAADQLASKMRTRMFDSLLKAAMHNGVQELVEAVEGIVRNHVPNEADNLYS
ncbi:hypothetical protein J4E93_006937 [Alternaria ventricosa]|uniref:uncharacterized protein n=1 Tax=Alternaria ventricosa TaxID=1187951 RepID=UPI0020C3F1BF|nr:uncharacterized protein J4E93_006937 [Alternaria ventricosa]KAI4642868.1 hypothetical protein J4E93_006937 [Alternaria ventricosa]